MSEKCDYCGLKVEKLIYYAGAQVCYHCAEEAIEEAANEVRKAFNERKKIKFRRKKKFLEGLLDELDQLFKLF